MGRARRRGSGEKQKGVPSSFVLDAFPCFLLASCLYRSAHHSLSSCACYLIGYRLVLSDEERKNETNDETLPRDEKRDARESERAYLIERDEIEKRRPAYCLRAALLPLVLSGVDDCVVGETLRIAHRLVERGETVAVDLAHLRVRAGLAQRVGAVLLLRDGS